MNRERVSILKGASLRNTALIFIVGVALHGAMLALFRNSYFEAMIQNIGLSFNIIREPVRQTYNWCYRYTGLFLIPLAGCLGFTAWRFFCFLLADLRKTPFTDARYQKMYDGLEYVGITVASSLGLAGTLIYVIVGLSLLAGAMINLSAGFAGGEVSTQMALLPEAFNTMARAALQIVVALGTTICALASECMVNHVNRIAEKWSKEGYI